MWAKKKNVIGWRKKKKFLEFVKYHAPLNTHMNIKICNKNSYFTIQHDNIKNTVYFYNILIKFCWSINIEYLSLWLFFEFFCYLFCVRRKKPSLLFFFPLIKNSFFFVELCVRTLVCSERHRMFYSIFISILNYCSKADKCTK